RKGRLNGLGGEETVSPGQSRGMAPLEDGNVLKRIDHIGVVVDTLVQARHFLASLGLRHDRDLEVSGRLRASFYTCGEIEIEVLEIVEPVERSRRLGDASAR